MSKDKKSSKLSKQEYQVELKRLYGDLVRLQSWVKAEGLRVMVIFEGRDAAGKGGVIKRITEPLNPRICRVVALGVPTEREKGQWYFQRYIQHLPSAGEIVLFDRSWYNRAGVERVMGYCTEEQYEDFLRACPELERMLIRSGIILLKYWFSVSDAEQEKRFQERLKNPLKRWKFSQTDLASRSRWVEYSQAKDNMFAYTDTRHSPWYVVDGDNKLAARLNCIDHLLSQIPVGELPEPESVELPEINRSGYVRPPKDEQQHIPRKYG